ncbi:fungal-specific transcription factor domain-containing protein [Hypoxylon crocopeplum]|nr:fungal-specific transcription factor domain-containing protein [Hypoxylon crocopeplum]
MDDDNNNNDAPTTSGRRKRPRSRHDGKSLACDQCRHRKIKCDRAQPECSNCRKTGVPCTSDNTSKRVNYTKELQVRDDFSSVLERLDGVDQTLTTLTQLTRQIAARPHTPITKASTPTSSLTQPTQTGNFSNYNAFLPSAQKDQSRQVVEKGCLHETVKLEDGGERTYGYPAALALMKALSRRLAQVLVDRGNELDSDVDGVGIVKDPVLRASLRRQLEDFPFQKCHQPVVTSDHRPITTPPRFLVDLFVDSFLRNINILTPIFDETSLRHAISAHYSSEPSGESNAWALIFNNIVILGLGLEAQVTRSSQSNSRNMNDDIFPSFLRNCERALAELNSFTRPSLVNVQALLTLALVARQFYGNIMFERVCQTTCQVGRILGLHQSKIRRSVDEDTTEHERLFRVLYVLDKQRVFLSGQPCDLHLFDSDLVLDSAAENELPSRRLTNAFDHMMGIWEEMYLALYSSRAVTADQACHARQVRRVAQLIDEWYKSHQGLMDAVLDDAVDLAHIQLELKYCYHVTQVLNLRRDRQDDISLQQLRDHARTCLKLISEAGSLPFTTTSLALLSRMLGNYPIVAFFDLAAFHFHSLISTGAAETEAGADFETFRAVYRHLQVLQQPGFPRAYFTYLLTGFAWILRVLDILKANSIGQPQALLDYEDTSPINQQYSNSFLAPVDPPCSVSSELSNSCVVSPLQTNSTVCLTQMPGTSEMGLVESGTELTNFDFYVPTPPTPLDLRSAPEFPIGDYMERNLESDFLQGLFAPEM